jgi:hypothetical protein
MSFSIYESSFGLKYGLYYLKDDEYGFCLINSKNIKKGQFFIALPLKNARSSTYNGPNRAFYVL